MTLPSPNNTRSPWLQVSRRAAPSQSLLSTRLFCNAPFDQLIHDVAIQNLDVLFAVDRASLLEDGPTHSGVFDYSFVRAIPNMVIMSPSNRVVMEQMLDFGFEYKGPCLVRYPRELLRLARMNHHCSLARRTSAATENVLLSSLLAPLEISANRSQRTST